MFRIKKKKKQLINQAFEDLKINILENLSITDKIILFTSSSEDIKTTSPLLNLARKISNEDKKVLLIDMNLRKPLLSKISTVEFNKGFSDILVEDCPYENTITQDLYVKNLDLVLSGRAMINAEEFFEMSKLRNLFDYMREKYDYVLIDSPTNETYPDANIISQSVDKVIVLTNKKDKNNKKVDQTIKKLKKMDAEILGLILRD